MPEEKFKEGEVSTKFYNFLAKQISRNSDYYWRFYSNFLVNTSKANISEKINLKLVGRKSLRRRGGNKFLFCPTTKNFKPIGVFLTILEALSCKTKYRKYLAKYSFPGIHICLTYFQYCNNEPDIPKSSIKQLWNLDPRYTSISPRSAIESYQDTTTYAALMVAIDKAGQSVDLSVDDGIWRLHNSAAALACT